MIKGNGGNKVMMINDVPRAFFEAPARRRVCVELPAAALMPEEREQGLLGLVQMSVYTEPVTQRAFSKKFAR